MSDLFTPEQEAEIKKKVDAAVTAATAQIHAQYSSFTSRLRDHIKAHPVPMATTSFFTGGIVATVLIALAMYLKG